MEEDRNSRLLFCIISRYRNSCFQYQRPVRHVCFWCSMLQGMTEEVKKQAEQRTKRRFIMDVLGIHNLALFSCFIACHAAPCAYVSWTKKKEYSKAGVMETLQNHENSRKLEITWIPRISIIEERSWSATSRTSSIKCACTNKGYAQSGMEEFDRVANAKKGFTLLLLQGGLTTEINGRSFHPTKAEAATP